MCCIQLQVRSEIIIQSNYVLYFQKRTAWWVYRSGLHDTRSQYVHRLVRYEYRSCFRLLKSLVSKNIRLPKLTACNFRKILKQYIFYTFYVGLSLRALLVVFRILNDNDTRRDMPVFATLIFFLGIFFYVFKVFPDFTLFNLIVER